jgi:polysaccharide export outer membrane protein
MKVNALIGGIGLVAGSFLLAGGHVSAQTVGKPPTKIAAAKAATEKPVLPAPTAKNDDPPAATSTPTNEEDAILPYYNNYLKEYRLGPSDMISIEVFGQCPDYCKTGLTVPPNARISYPLIRDGVMVAGKTVEEVAADITKKLDEFIIDPKVTVTLDKAMSNRYSVMGHVATPGIRVMDRRVSVYEAVLEAGGVTRKGNRDKIAVMRYGKDGKLTRSIVSLAAMEKGTVEMVYLNPGDQVFVTGRGFTLDTVFDILGKASVVRFLFGSPF